MNLRTYLLVLLLVCVSVQSYPCTIFSIVRDGKVFVGNNEDERREYTAKSWFIQPRDGKYGCVLFGWADGWAQGGMNDQGLFFDGNALKYAIMKSQPDKPLFFKDRDPVRTFMEECATVDDVVKLLTNFNLKGFNNGQCHFADKTGDAAVIGADKNGDLFVIRKKGTFQVSTNFNLANPEFGLESLKEAGFTARMDWILSAEIPDVPGGLLNAVVRPLAAAGVNLKYCYAYIEQTAGDKAMVVLKTDDLEKSEEILAGLRG